MGFPVDTGIKDYSSTGTSKWIPQVWAAKLVEKFYAATVFSEICNTDYEGEIKSYGDKVVIRTRASITINNYVKGAGLTYQQPESANVDLDIDQGKYFAFELFKVDEVQSDLNLMDEWATDGAEQMKIAVDTAILAAIPTGAAAANAGNTAGAKSGNIVLGTSGSPLALTKTNILDFIVDCGTVLDEQNRPESNRYLVLPAKACGMIKKSDLKDASLSGDGTSILRNGRLGMIDRFTIYSSNNLAVSSGKYDVVFGHKSAVTFAAQITHMEKLPNPDDFGELARSLFVYGFEVINAGSLGHAVVTT